MVVAMASQASQQQSTNTSLISKLEAAKWAKVLFGQYRTGEANDPEIYVRTIAAILGHYPQFVSAQVCDPYSGIATKVEWLPKPKEVKDACEEAMRPIYREREEEIRREQRQAALAAPQPVRMTAEEMEARYGKNYGLSGAKTAARQSDVRSLEQICAEVGLTMAQFEAIYADQTKLEKKK